jgi:hypothetical protein
MGDYLDLRGRRGSDLAAKLAIRWCVRAQWAPGDYLEFGTFRGESLVAFVHAAEAHGLDDMRFFGFDSFEGLPETPTCPPARSTDSEASFVAGNYACSQEELTQILKKNDVDMAKVTLVPGFYDQSLTPELKKSLPIERAAVVNIDCDLYESTVDVLAFVTSYLRDGTLLLFDDWLAFAGHPLRGERRACREWLERNPDIHLTEYFKYTHSGVAFIVSRLSADEQRALGRSTGASRLRRGLAHPIGPARRRVRSAADLLRRRGATEGR